MGVQKKVNGYAKKEWVCKKANGYAKKRMGMQKSEWCTQKEEVRKKRKVYAKKEYFDVGLLEMLHVVQYILHYWGSDD